MTSLVAQMVKHLPTVWETRVQSLGREDLLEKGMATHSSILASPLPVYPKEGLKEIKHILHLKKKQPHLSVIEGLETPVDSFKSHSSTFFTSFKSFGGTLTRNSPTHLIFHPIYSSSNINSVFAQSLCH